MEMEMQQRRDKLNELSLKTAEKLLLQYGTLLNKCGEGATMLLKLAKQEGFELKRVGGLYGREGYIFSEHNWCVDQNGDIYDPTARQFDKHANNGFQDDQWKELYVPMTKKLIEECIDLARAHGWFSSFFDGMSQIGMGYGILLDEQRIGRNLENTLRLLGINTRDAEIDRSTLTWIRDNHVKEFDSHVKVDAKKRTFVAWNYIASISWMPTREIETKDIGYIKQMATISDRVFDLNEKFRPKVTSGIIQMNVLRAKGKRGGWLIRIHKQKPVLSSRTNQFVFSGNWVGYWASDKMWEKGLVAKAVKGKFGNARLVDRTELKYLEEDINESIRILRNIPKGEAK
jgi:hypothetical protein